MEELPDIDDDDLLGREMFSKRRVRKAERGLIDPSIFEPPRDKDTLSVDRLDLAPDEKMAEIGDMNGSSQGKPFFGWAQVIVRNARARGREVLASPRLDNPYHADIVLPLPDGEERRDAERQHALNLAKNASFRPRP